jgi:hypothetical protein
MAVIVDIGGGRRSRSREGDGTTADLMVNLISQLSLVGLPKPARELPFHPRSRWRFDLAWPDQRVAVEVDGGTWVTGGSP